MPTEEPQAEGSPNLLDACAVLSLYATRRMADILAAALDRCAVVDLVEQEALYVRRLVEGEVVQEPVDLRPLVGSGALSVMAAESEAELQTYIDLAVDLDDGEALTAAVAIHRGGLLVTDDRKAERLLAGRVRLRSTLAVIKDWADATAVAPATLLAVLTDVYDRGYQPPARHPLKSWWDASIGGDEDASGP